MMGETLTLTKTKLKESTTMNLLIEFGGGMELLFSNQHEHLISIPLSYIPLKQQQQQITQTTSILKQQQQLNLTKPKPVDIKYLIWWLKENLIADKERTELFSQGESIRPGILILINSTDWELEGELEYELQQGDEIVFISTLHGG